MSGLLTKEPTVPRTYLYVPPEEKTEVQALGARWDAAAKRWYIEGNEPRGKFSRWLSDAKPYAIVSHEACVVALAVPCQYCGATIEVICIHCFGGTVQEEPRAQFTVSDIREMDEPLAGQLALWPQFRKDGGADGVFANHCTSCSEAQEDRLLHCEPGEPFFDVPAAIASGLVICTPLIGTIRLYGNEHCLIE